MMPSPPILPRFFPDTAERPGCATCTEYAEHRAPLRPPPSSAVFTFFFQAEDGIRATSVTGVQTCALPICNFSASPSPGPIGSVVEYHFGARVVQPERECPTDVVRGPRCGSKPCEWPRPLFPVL